ncbi:transcriptional regulator, LysR family [Tolumonas auensis DSM 9187]|jgi:DNA-binding transcriptional LysR family regulator|uniref:Transcriptional regulator, LysR family n=1 Tax=Tolumonas auensis (strain DSM 9187 / NBRC 110442 / TA 4) TaxID=595494 RepID=C4LEU7_TOLAT|nr:LysR family transcriptional regulator [Tolumonas auensis]ACQ93114.1 transcriptional regulator, LysR family [Tolumonas auensis DSM 9187]
MNDIDLNNLLAFIVVARERSFTRAAAQLGVSQSALSHTIRRLEEKMGIRLLTRTTRGVSTTEAGERLYINLGPHYEGIQTELSALYALNDKPAGTIRISTHDRPADTILWPKLSKLLPLYPELNIEISINYELIDIVAERFDAGVRLGDQVAKDMIAVRISPDVRMAVVGAPSYFKNRVIPQTPQELTGQNCIRLRLPTHGGIYAWEFEKGGQILHVQVQGQMIFNQSVHILNAALQGYGIAYLPEEQIKPYVDQGQLIQLLEPWCPTFPGYHLYFPSRRQSSPAFSLVVDTLRYRT